MNTFLPFSPIQPQPREKLTLYGPEELEDKELFALILGKGNAKESVFEIANRLLKNFDQQELLTIKNVKKFQECFQVGFVQATQLIATFEIGRRFFTKETPSVVLRTADQVYEFVKNMKYLKKEHVRGLYVNTRYRLMHDEIITIGGLGANIIHPREVFRPAIEFGAYAFILVHNHPSGDPTPSDNDREITTKLKKVAKILQIPLLDHVIVGENSYMSFSRENRDLQ